MGTDWAELARLYYAGEAVLRQKIEKGVPQQTYAYAAGFPTKHPNWRELKIWIDPAKRAEIEVAALLGDLLTKIANLRLFCITNDLSLVAVAETYGFKIIELGVLPGDMQPIDWAYETGTVSRLPRSVHWSAAMVELIDERLLVL